MRRWKILSLSADLLSPFLLHILDFFQSQASWSVTSALTDSTPASSSGWLGSLVGGCCQLSASPVRFGWTMVEKNTVLLPLVKPVQGAWSDVDSDVNSWA